YVAEIKLRHLNKEYILKRTGEIEQLEKDIAEMQDILANEKKIGKIIISELEDVKKKYGQPRKTQFIYAGDIEEESVEEEVSDYPVNLFLTKSGYFKKITPLSLRMGGEQKFKEGDTMAFSIETTNRADILFFSDKSQVYKAKASQFQDTKASNLGEFIPAKLGFDEGENLASMAVTLDYSETLLFFFENGKVAKVPINAYETKLNRKKLNNAYSDKNPLVKMIEIKDNTDILIKSTSGKALVFNSGMILPKTTKNTIGVAVMTLKSKSKVESAYIVTEELAPDVEKYRAKNIPAAGSYARDLEDYEQLTF
ncbi:MAG: topoisomerase IV, partial [Oscillospiraceae bacterium]|nr:topoisomerase IV [Oscillospiraceae bacterium]